MKKSDKQKDDFSKFKIPKVIQSQKFDKADYFHVDSMQYAYCPMIDKYKFSDTIINFSLQNWKHRDGRTEEELMSCDTINTDGLQVRTDYKSSIAFKFDKNNNTNLYYPVFIVNETNNLKTIIGQDDLVFAIQEALDSSGYWRPIEKRCISFCGNGYWALNLNPKEYAMFLTHKYQGEFKTLLRVRIKIGNNIYVSQPFKGSINPNQFFLIRKDCYAPRDYKEIFDYAGAVMIKFYGAIPLEFDSKYHLRKIEHNIDK